MRGRMTPTRLLTAAGSVASAIATVLSVSPATAQVAPRVIVADIGAATPETVAPGLTRRYVTGDQTTLGVFNFEKGAIVPEHQHPNEQVTYILSGHVEVTVAGRPYQVRAGQVIIIPANTPHRFEALEETIDIDFFTPARADWLSGTAGYFTRPEASGEDE
jgi:quercetin dioxygenase-like cupin family protein